MRVPRRSAWLDRALVLVALGLCGGVVGAQVEPAGPELQLNTYTTGDQHFPLIASQPGGGFAVVWYSSPSYPERRVLGRTIDAEARPTGVEFEVSENAATAPSGLACDGLGQMVAIWGHGTPGPGSGHPGNAYGRRFGPGGKPLGPQFVINENGPQEYLYGGNVAVQSSGEFVVVWEEYGARGQRFAADGSRLGGNFEIAGSPGFSAFPQVARRPAGGFVVAWREADFVAGDYTVRAQRFDAEGLPAGDVVPVDASGVAPWGVLVASDAGGGFVVVWTREAVGATPPTIRARRFSAGGQPFGPTFRVDGGPATAIEARSVATEHDGGFVIAWHALDAPADPDGAAVLARRYSFDAIPLGPEFQLNSATAGDQLWPSLAFAPTGDLVAAWSSETSTGDDDSGTSIQVRRFRLPFFIDGFESGDLSRWSSTFP